MFFDNGNQLIHTEVIIMAIEPLGSVMSVQAQKQIQTKPVTQTTNAEYTDVSAQETIQQTDPTIRIVENTRKKGDSDAKNGDNANTMKQPSNEQIKKAVEAFNKKFGSSEAIFGIHEATNRITIKIVDKDTKEVIKELPPEKTLDMIAKVWEMAGILVDEKR